MVLLGDALRPFESGLVQAKLITKTMYHFVQEALNKTLTHCWIQYSLPSASIASASKQNKEQLCCPPPPTLMADKRLLVNVQTVQILHCSAKCRNICHTVFCICSLCYKCSCCCSLLLHSHLFPLFSLIFYHGLGIHSN